MFTVCGKEKEDCVANQTLKDKSCLIPCTGLYADIVDDTQTQTTLALELRAFQQSVTEGT